MRVRLLVFFAFALTACTQSSTVVGSAREADQFCASSGLALFSQGRINDAIAAWRTDASADQSAVAMLQVLRLWDAIDQTNVDMGPLVNSLASCVHDGSNGAKVIVGTIGLLKPELRLPASPEQLFRDAARSGHLFASLGLAVLAERGSDRALARKHLTESIALNPTELGHRAGLLYLSEIFVARDPAEGARYIRRTADSGNWKSQQLMSMLFAEGIGVEPNSAEAARYQRLADENPSRDDSRNADAVIESIGPTRK